MRRQFPHFSSDPPKTRTIAQRILGVLFIGIHCERANAGCCRVKKLNKVILDLF